MLQKFTKNVDFLKFRTQSGKPFIEGLDHIPFDIKRIYYLEDVER